MASPLANSPTHIQKEPRPGTRRPKFNLDFDLPTPLRLWHLASLDAPTVAVVWSFAFARAMGVHLSAWVLALLALGTWAVYVGDRLLDTGSALRSGDLSQLRERHYFHWTHRRVLTPFAVLAAVASAAIIFLFMPAGIRERNSVLAVAAVAYFSGIHISVRQEHRSRLFSKEFMVGVLFTAGCAFPTLSRLPATGIVQLWHPFATFGFFAMLAWLNCHAIDRWEAGANSAIQYSACLLGMFGLVLAFIFGSAQTTSVSSLVLQGSISALLLAVLNLFRSRMRPLALRAAADLALLTPLFLFAR